jgi:hypothetical protein
MITPAYAPTATERVLPRMALDFTTGVLDPRVTVTRALNTATRVNSSGFVEGVNANLPRFDYDPVTLAPKGLLIEEMRTNVLQYSDQINQAPWTASNVTFNANAAISPDGTQNADKMVTSVANIAKFVSQSSLTSTTGSFSIYAKADGETVISLWLVNATVGASFTLTGSGSTALLGATASSITAVGNGWYRCVVYHNAASTTAHIYFRNGSSFAGNGTSGVFLWGAQFEAGAFATSYIPTTTTSLTRNADVVSMTGTNFSSWYNASEGTFAVGFGALNVSPNSSTLICASDSPLTNDWVLMYASSTAILNRVRVTGVDQGSINISGSPAIGGNAVLTYKANSFAASLNGGTPGTDASGTVPTDILRLWIGTFDGTNTVPSFANGCIKSVRYWPQRVTNAETQSFSK